jgi:hypothetical protein
MLVVIFSLVDWMKKMSFTLTWDVVKVGAGHAVKNTVVNIIKTDLNVPMQKILTQIAVRAKKDLFNQSIVKEVIHLIAINDGK